MFNRKITTLASVLALAFALSATSCGKKPGSAPSGETTAPAGEKTEAAAPAAPAAPAAGTGSIKGKVSFTGTAPEMPALKREADPFCAKTPMKDEAVVVNSNGTLKNVAVTVQGAPAAVPEGEVHAEIDQANCMYSPRVVTAAFDQNLKIVNSDPILHNVHTYADAKTLFNRAQPKGSPAIDKKFSKDDGSVVKFKCDVHPWMTGWLILNDNGLNAVTGDSGEFEIKNVPAGTYKIQAWHETYGPKTVDVTVEADKAAEANISFDGTEKTAYNFKEVEIAFGQGHHH